MAKKPADRLLEDLRRLAESRPKDRAVVQDAIAEIERLREDRWTARTDKSGEVYMLLRDRV